MEHSGSQGRSEMQQSLPAGKSILDSSVDDGFHFLQAAQLQEALSETDRTVLNGEPPKPDSTNADQDALKDTPLEDRQQHAEPQKPALTPRGPLMSLDYEMQLRLLEAQNKRRLEMARQEQAESAVHSSQTQRPMNSPPQPMFSAMSNASKQEYLKAAIRHQIYILPPNERMPPQMVLMMQSALVNLQQEEKQLIRRQSRDTKEATFAVFHCISREEGEKIYFDQPRWVRRGDKFVLEADSPVPHPEAYGFHKRLDFVVYKLYSKHTRMVTKETSQQGIECPVPFPQPDGETVRLFAEEMVAAMKKLAKRNEATQKKLSNLVSDKEILAPHLWWYIYRSRMDMLDGLSPPEVDAMQILTRWMDEAYSKPHSQADDQFKRGMVSASSMSYLIQPGDVLVCKVEGGFEARLATSWLQEVAPRPSTQESDEVPPFAFDKRIERRWEVDAWSYGYDGDLYQMTTTTSIQLDADATQDAELPIADLDVSPLQFASEEVRLALERRGKAFWDCRNGKHVSYGTKKKNDTTEQRYMIHWRVYHDRHPTSDLVRNVRRNEDILGAEKVRPAFYYQGDASSEPHVYLFPRTVIGYNLRQHKWEEVNVDLIREVFWNKNLLNQLIAKTKELLYAAVTSHIASQTEASQVQGTGDGLVMLLHGPAGTGKTFTVESIAESVERPLHVVRCSDIGTTPEAVEMSLRSIFSLAERWGCIVLLAEAELFLEQRNFNDVTRNALVSAFLRCLESYSGVLFLESNALKTLDDDFQLRIQLVSYYDLPTEPERVRIWLSLFENMELMDETGMNPAALSRCVDELAKWEMNGHQMRNLVTTARQLAQHRDQKLTLDHLSYVFDLTHYP